MLYLKFTVLSIIALTWIVVIIHLYCWLAASIWAYAQYGIFPGSF